MLAIVAPGQGSQSPGFLRPWLEHVGFVERLRAYGDAVRLDLVHLGTAADAPTLRDTAVAQPVVVGAGLAAAQALGVDSVAACGVVAGHSVGEITVAGLAAVTTDLAAVRVARARGLAMAAASSLLRTGMTAVVGGDPVQVAELAHRHGLHVATRNGTGQLVVAGEAEALSALAHAPPPRARLVPLEVAGAFHTEHMATALPAVRAALGAIEVHDPAVPVVSGLEGAVVTSGRELVSRIVAQVVRPVRWDLCQATLRDLGVTGLLELPPAGTLSALARRALPGVETVTLRGPGDLDAARSLVARHGAT